MIRIDGATIALSTSCSVELAVQFIDARVKRDSGNNNIVDIISFTMSSESLVGMSDDTQKSYDKLLRAMLLKAAVEVSTMLAVDTIRGVPVGGWIPRGENASRGFIPIRGRAFIERLTIKGNKDGNATMSIALAGQGLPTITSYDSSLIAAVDNTTLLIGGDNAALSGDKLILGDKAVVEDEILKI